MFVVFPERGHGFFIPCCALSPAREEWEAASVQAGLRARRFAEKQYTRRLVRPWALLGGQLCSKWWKMREIRQSRDLAGLRGSWLERGGDNFKSSLRLQRCVTCHPGAGAQGPNRHGSCTQPLPSRRQGLERDLPSLAAEPQLLPGPPGSLVLSANLQVLRGCLPTCSSRSLRGFSGQPSGLATRPPDNLVGIKHPVLRSFTRGTIPGKRTPGGLDKNTRDTFRDIHRAESHLLLCPKCVDTACWNKLAVRFLREMRRARKRFIASRG